MQYAPPTTEVFNRRKKTCLDCICIVFQLLVLLAFLLLIIASITGTKELNRERSTTYALFIIIYIIYLVVEFCSSSCSYLMHKSSAEGIYQKMYRIFSTHPEIIFHCENYHFEIVGRDRDRRKQKVVTYREDYSMPYYSARDISGAFILNCDREIVKNKAYIQLEIMEEINFADNISYMDYECVSRDFYMRNRPRDYYMTYSETRVIPGLTKYNLVRIGDSEPTTVNIGAFILCTILMCAEFYKCHVDKLCVPQRFTVRKIISTRYDLNLADRYQYFMPALDLYDQQYTYQPQDYNYMNNDYQLDLPTKEDLERAEQYSNKVPDYQIQSYTYVNGDIKVGVVKDDPSYCSANYSNNLPPGCEQKNREYIEQFAQKYDEQGVLRYPSL